MYGYSGKILHIDLTERKTWSESKPEEWYKIYIGGVSMATRLCWDAWCSILPVIHLQGMPLERGKILVSPCHLALLISGLHRNASVWACRINGTGGQRT